MSEKFDPRVVANAIEQLAKVAPATAHRLAVALQVDLSELNELAKEAGCPGGFAAALGAMHAAAEAAVDDTDGVER
jgi:hypothetical protein